MVFGMPRVLFPALARDAVPPWSGRGRADVQRARARRVRRRPHVGLGRPDPPPGPCDHRGGRMLGRRDHRVWAGRSPLLARARVPGGGRRRRCDLRGVPSARSNNSPFRTTCAVDCLRSTSSSSRADPGSATSKAVSVASIFTPEVSVVSGGLLCLAGVGVIAAPVPRFARWRVGRPALIDPTGTARLTAPRGGVFGDSPYPETRHPAGRTRRAGARAGRLRARARSDARRCAAASSSARATRRRALLRDAARRVGTALRHARARDRAPRAVCGSRGRSAPRESRPIYARASCARSASRTVSSTTRCARSTTRGRGCASCSASPIARKQWPTAARR